MAVAEQFRRQMKTVRRDPTGVAFFWLSAFFVVYCARPEDWIPGLVYIPMAKISAFFAVLGVLSCLGGTQRSFKDLPREAKYLLAMIGLLFVGAPLSSVWRGGAVMKTLEFSKVYLCWLLIFLLVTSVKRLKQLIFVQAGCVATVSLISVLKGSSQLRLHGVLSGIYANPNDLAFAIVLTLPLTLLLLLTAKNALLKMAWAGAMLVMLYTLFLTASRAGFIDLVIMTPVALWFFGIKGKRPQLIFITLLAGVLILGVSGKHLRERLFAMTGSNLQTGLENSAYGSYEERKFLMERALSGLVHHPLTGVGAGDFVTYSGIWKQVHMTYLQIGVEGGIPVLILYALFFYSGFRTLRELRKKPDLDPEVLLFVWALYCCLLGFLVGACFAPEAYQFFPYFTVAYIAALYATVREKERGETGAPIPQRPRLRRLYGNIRESRAAQLTR